MKSHLFSDRNSLISCPTLRPVRLPRNGQAAARKTAREAIVAEQKAVREAAGGRNDNNRCHPEMIGMVRDNNPILTVITRTLTITTDLDVRQHHMFPIQLGSNVDS